MMRTYRISNTYHKVFDDKEELPSGIDVIPEWRNANIGDWVEADDGCIIKLNGKEVIRHNMPEGEALSETWATQRVSGWREKNALPLPVAPRFLQVGVNRIMVRVHQADPQSADLIFDLSVRAK